MYVVLGLFCFVFWLLLFLVFCLLLLFLFGGGSLKVLKTLVWL